MSIGFPVQRRLVDFTVAPPNDGKDPPLTTSRYPQVHCWHRRAMPLGQVGHEISAISHRPAQLPPHPQASGNLEEPRHDPLRWPDTAAEVRGSSLPLVSEHAETGRPSSP